MLGALDERVEGAIKDFYDPKFEGRRLFAELIGTFFLVLVACGGAVVNAQSGGQIPLAVRVTAPGLMVMAMILFMGGASGAHFNPVVSVGFAMRRDFPWRRVPGYVIVQLIGAVLAVLFLRATLGNIGGLGVTEPGPGISRHHGPDLRGGADVGPARARSWARPRARRTSACSARSASGPTSRSRDSGRRPSAARR